MALGQTVTVVNKSGKVVSTGKHLVNVFKEAKSAYRERKAEISALRDAEESERQARKAIERLAIEDDGNASRASSRHSHKSSRSRGERSHREKPIMERGYTDSFYENDHLYTPPRHRPSNLRLEYDVNDNPRNNELVRRHSEAPVREVSRPKTSRSASVNDIDKDLAYGELPPPLPLRPHGEEVELRSKMTKLQGLLDEANCVQHSVIAMIENLQKNPDALAAVALTLGEISNIASKMAPGMITAMKGSFPAVIALLASPEFLIAAGVGVGVTIIMLGGYKIIKKIKERNDDGPMLEQAAPLPAPPRQAEIAESAADEEEEFDELREIDSELSRIEVWRRGIADAEEASMGTSVEGEFITPGATRTLIEEGVMREDDLKSTRTGRTSRTKKSSRSSRHHHGDSHSSTTTKEKSRKSSTKKKEPSGLRMLFKSHA